jgi:hypothetical protein
MSSFLSFLSKANPSIYASLKGKAVGSSSFNNTWKSIASSKNAEFEKVQHDFIQSTHYQPTVEKIFKNTGISVASKSAALQNVIWSMGVQHGSNGAYGIWANAGIKAGMSDREIIQRLYAERSKVDKYFSKSSSAIKRSVYNRFQSELKDALAML